MIDDDVNMSQTSHLSEKAEDWKHGSTYPHQSLRYQAVQEADFKNLNHLPNIDRQ